MTNTFDYNEAYDKLNAIKREIEKLEHKLAIKYDDKIMSKIKELQIEYSYIENDISYYGQHAATTID